MINKKLIYVLLAGLILLPGCNHIKSKNAINSSNNAKETDIIKQLESNHFNFYSKEKDKGCLKDLSNALEDNYSRVTDDLHASLDKKVDVYIYSDLNTYHEASNQPDAPNWLIGNANPGSCIIQMVNPSKAAGYTYSDFMKVIVHEFTHIATQNINPDITTIPLWISEGVAVYEAKQDDGVKQVVSKAKAANKVPKLKDLETDPYNFGNNGGYQFSYSVVDYIIKTYGYEKLIALLKSPTDFKNILGVTKEELGEKWSAQIN